MQAESPKLAAAGKDHDVYRLRAAQSQHHPDCFVCGRHRAHGLGMSFQLGADGGVESHVNCRALFQGYPGFMHGGIVSALLNGAMTNCLFARGVKAMTGELTVRFLLPVKTNCAAVVRARYSVTPAPVCAKL
jgi:acyl-coenzyme A thioesterase PaaI-like protein